MQARLPGHYLNSYLAPTIAPDTQMASKVNLEDRTQLAAKSPVTLTLKPLQ
jgi:hypothetical protein